MLPKLLPRPRGLIDVYEHYAALENAWPSPAAWVIPSPSEREPEQDHEHLASSSELSSTSSPGTLVSAEALTVSTPQDNEVIPNCASKSPSKREGDQLEHDPEDQLVLAQLRDTLPNSAPDPKPSAEAQVDPSAKP